MVINYQDKNMIVTYLQIYLSEYLGLTVHKVIPRKKTAAEYYEITSNDPLVVTGYYNLQTYSALALYMAYNYPNEGYPIKWTKSLTKGWTSEDYIYDGDQTELLKIIQDNMEYATENMDVVQVPERVLSYIFNEVVTPKSSPEEVLRIRQLVQETIYANQYSHALDYTEGLFDTIVDIQQSIIDKYTTKYSEEDEVITMADSKTTYEIGKKLSNVSTSVTETFAGEVQGNVITITLVTDKIFEAKVYYNNNPTEEQTTTIFENLGNGQWRLIFDEDIGTIIEDGLIVTYEEPFKYDTITGYLTFSQYTEGKKVKVIKTINEEVVLPIQFKDFKVTGYVDPWTEILLKEGYEDGDS